MSIWTKIKNKSKRMREERGSFAMSALVLIPTFMFGTALVGTAADAYLAKIELQKAADASAIAMVYQIHEWILDPHANITPLGQPERPGQYLKFEWNDDRKALEIDFTKDGWDIVENIRTEYVYKNTRKTDKIIPGTYHLLHAADKKEKTSDTNYVEVNVGRRVPVWGGKFFGLLANNKKGVLSIPVIATARAGFPQKVQEVSVGHRPPLAVIVPHDDQGGYYKPRKNHLVNLSLRPADLGTRHYGEEVGLADAKRNRNKRNNLNETYEFAPILGLVPVYYQTGKFSNYAEKMDYDTQYFRGTVIGKRYSTQSGNTTFESRFGRDKWERYGDWLDGNVGDTKEIPKENDYKMNSYAIALGPDVNHVDAAWATGEKPPKPIMRDALKKALERRIEGAKKLAKEKNISVDDLSIAQDPRVIIMPMYKVQNPAGVPNLYGKYVHATGQPFALKGMYLESMCFGWRINDGSKPRMYKKIGYVAVRIDSVDYGLYQGYYNNDNVELVNQVLPQRIRNAYLKPKEGQLPLGNTAGEETNPNHQETGVTWQGVFFMQNLEVHGEVVEVSGDGGSASNTAVFNIGTAQALDAVTYDVRLLPKLTVAELRKLGYAPPFLGEDEGW